MLLGAVQMCGEKLSHVEVEDVCQSLESNNIRLLSLRDCKVKDQDFQKLMNSVGVSKSIMQLNLNLGLVGSIERVHSLSAALQKNRTLTSLFLHGSPLGDNGAALLCAGLALHPNIVNLDLGDCLLTDNCIGSITDLLPPNGAKRGLVELTLSANPGISTQGWTKLFIGLSASSTLKTLNLDYNTIGDYGAGCLAVMLASNNTLETLDLEGSGMSEFGAQAFLFLIRNYPVVIQKIVFNENMIRASTMQAIENGLEKGSLAGSVRSSNEEMELSSSLNSTTSSSLGSSSFTSKEESHHQLAGNTNFWSVSGDTQGSMAWATPSQTLNSTYTVERINPQMIKSGTQKALEKKQSSETMRAQGIENSGSDSDESSEADTVDEDDQLPQRSSSICVKKSGQQYGLNTTYTSPDTNTKYEVQEQYRSILKDTSSSNR